MPSNPRADDINTILPPSPCASICLLTARAINQDCVTLASITSRKRSGVISTIFDTSFLPDATTRISTRPNRCLAASTIPSQSFSEEGRLLIGSTSAPMPRHLATICSSSLALPAVNTSLAPAARQNFGGDGAEKRRMRR